MKRVNSHPKSHPSSACPAARFLAFSILVSVILSSPTRLHAQLVRLPSGKGGIVNLEAKQQRRQGDLFIADGDVDIRYGDLRLRADHVEYNAKTADSSTRGHVQFDYLNQYLDSDEASYNVRSGQGVFRKVRGTIKIDRLLRPRLRVSTHRARTGAHRKPVPRRVCDRQHRHLRQSSPPGKDILKSCYE